VYQEQQKATSVEEGRILAQELGVAIAKAGHALLTGATIGLPNYAAEGCKKAGGQNEPRYQPGFKQG